MDVRAYSRQRGFKAYTAHTSQPARYVAAQSSSRSASFAKQKKETAETEKASAAADEKTADKKTDQTDEMKKYIEDNPHVKPDI